MKKKIRFFAMLMLLVLLFVQVDTIHSKAAFSDLKRHGVDLQWKKGNWCKVVSKIPGKKGLSPFYAKITKFKKSTFPSGNSGGSSSSSSGNAAATTTAVVTIQVQIPKALTKKAAKALLQSGHDYIDYLDVLVVDKSSGENLNTEQTSEEGVNNYGVSVTQTDWRGFKPQMVSWSNGTVYQYYVSYVKTLIIKYPSTYTRACVGICGSHISDYDKMIDWNEAFMKGYTVLSDTTHVKLGSKSKTKQLAHFYQLK